MEFRALVENSVQEKVAAVEKVKESRSENAKNVVAAADKGRQRLISKIFYDLFP